MIHNTLIQSIQKTETKESITILVVEVDTINRIELINIDHVYYRLLSFFFNFLY